MIGAICIIIFIFVAMNQGLNNFVNNENCKTKYYDPTTNTYTDRQGYSRLSSNNQKVYISHDLNGQRIVQDLNGHILQNVSMDTTREEMKNDRAKRANGEHITVTKVKDFNSTQFPKGYRYIDLDSGRTYTTRRLICHNFEVYIDIDTFQIVRPSDLMYQFMSQEDIDKRFDYCKKYYTRERIMDELRAGF